MKVATAAVRLLLEARLQIHYMQVRTDYNFFCLFLSLQLQCNAMG